MLPQLATLAALIAGSEYFRDDKGKKKKDRKPSSEKKKQAIKEYLRKSKEKERKIYKGKNDNTSNKMEKDK